MSVNIPKTKAMIITPAQKQAIIQESPPEIKIDSNIIDFSRQEKLLGVTIDCTRNWAAHVETTIKKCNSLLYLLGRIKHTYIYLQGTFTSMHTFSHTWTLGKLQ